MVKNTKFWNRESQEKKITRKRKKIVLKNLSNSLLAYTCHVKWITIMRTANTKAAVVPNGLRKYVLHVLTDSVVVNDMLHMNPP